MGVGVPILENIAVWLCLVPARRIAANVAAINREGYRCVTLVTQMT